MGCRAVFAARWNNFASDRKPGKVEGMTLYEIANWDELYENNRTRELKSLQWVPIPTKLDGDGYTELVDRENGAAIYGCWVGCVIIASRCEIRGKLLRSNGTPHDARSLSRICRLDVEFMEEMLEVAVSLGWITTSGESQEGAGSLRGSAHRKERKGKEENRKEEKGKNTLSSSTSSLDSRGADVDAVVNHYRKHHPRSNPDAKARKAIQSRFRDGFSVSDLCEAIDGMHKTPHNIGENERGAKYLGLELCMRTSDQVQRFIENCHDPPRAVSEKFLKGERAGSEFLKITGGNNAK